LTQFSFDKTVDAKREIVFDIFSNFERYQILLPQHFPSVRIRSIRGNVAVVEEHLNLGEREFVIMAKHVKEEPVLHDIFVIGGDAKGSHISQQFLELSDKTKIIVNVSLKFGGKMKIPNIFRKNTLVQDYGKIIDDFIKIAET
jgi:coenzyme Q-binding protein COQ10